jgi:uncharacterized membrane protein YqgA involved in biofilm formation
MSEFVAAIFPDEAKLTQATRAIDGLHAQGSVTLYASTVVAKDSSGRVSVERSPKKDLAGQPWVEATKCVVGIAVMMLSARLLLSPFPLSNIIPALVIVLISLAYREHDGLTLAIGIFGGLVVLTVDLGVIWEIVHGAKRIRVLV